MRGLVAAIMLLIQLQPVLGVGICAAMGETDPDLMEAGCPMPGSDADQKNHRAVGWSEPASPHDCAFAEACAPSPTVAVTAAPGIVNLPLHGDRVISLHTLVLPAEVGSPPVPPPKA